MIASVIIVVWILAGYLTLGILFRWFSDDQPIATLGKEACELDVFGHDWEEVERYGGYRCNRCGQFVEDGREPWAASEWSPELN